MHSITSIAFPPSFLTVQLRCSSEENVLPGVAYLVAVIIIVDFITKDSSPRCANPIMMGVVVNLYVISVHQAVDQCSIHRINDRKL